MSTCPRASSLVLKLLLSFHPPVFFFVSGYFLVWCFEGFVYAASGVKDILLWIVLCALLPLFLCFGPYCDGGILECAELGVCFFLFSFFGYSEPFCGWLRFRFVL
jgi:hypothetical protein